MNANNKAVNEPILSYDPGSLERKKLQAEYDRMAQSVIDIPLIINVDKKVFSSTSNPTLKPRGLFFI